jgi:hypothetical protein
MKVAERAALVGAFGLMLWLLWSMVAAAADWYGIEYRERAEVPLCQLLDPHAFSTSHSVSSSLFGGVRFTVSNWVVSDLTAGG